MKNKGSSRKAEKTFKDINHGDSRLVFQDSQTFVNPVSIEQELHNSLNSSAKLRKY